MICNAQDGPRILRGIYCVVVQSAGGLGGRLGERGNRGCSQQRAQPGERRASRCNSERVSTCPCRFHTLPPVCLVDSARLEHVHYQLALAADDGDDDDTHLGSDDDDSDNDNDDKVTWALPAVDQLASLSKKLTALSRTCTWRSTNSGSVAAGMKNG